MYRFFLRLSQIMAWIGGFVLVGIVLLICVSVVGRTANGWLHGDAAQAFMPGLANGLLDTGIGPVNGDFELTEALVAFAIFAFLPLCQITGGHATVDIFTQKLPDRANRILRALTDAVFGAVMVLIAVQLYAGMISKLGSGQTTFLLQFPVWWGYALSLLGAGIAAAVSVWIALTRWVEMATGRTILPTDLGAEH
ncbi:TRAP transporter small permease [Loktanella sp. SALINAS62]|uniref:TRAP transporter small permease n=1 Tax=Loktanella sp. SALINAS62 TaxID=2706124 RepID=UPI001B8B6E5E|nr:TRAP transporter small permease [Loktanella sp. SALINAS62]MBS1300744.1 TRAP transporter small permease [Loktanella sp. SALINAS62]